MRNKEERLGINTQQSDGLPPQITALNKEERSLDLNFITPTDLIDLPSKGLFYGKEHPLYRSETIEIKQMTAKEEDILTSRGLLKKGIALDKLIQALIVDKRIDPDSLTLSDRNAIIIAARISGYGHEYVTQVTCPACQERTKFTFNLFDKVEKETDKSFCCEVNENGLFEFELPITKWKVICKALNGYDEKTLTRISEIKKKNNSLNDSVLFDQLRCMVVSIQSVTDREMIEKALASMPAKDSRHIRNCYQQTVEDVDLTRNFACKKCDYEADVEVPLSADFFWFK